MGVTAATMSLAIDRLERKGYVVRMRDAVDRRRVHVRLTTAGVRVRQASSVLDPARVEALVARLGDEEREAAIRAWRCSPKRRRGRSRRHEMDSCHRSDDRLDRCARRADRLAIATVASAHRANKRWPLRRRRSGPR